MASSGFPEAVLGPLCSKIGSGATPRGGDKVYLNEGEVALIRSQNVYNDGFNRDGLVFIAAEHADQLSNVTVQPEDILLNITGDSVARCCQVDPHVLPARVNQHVAIIRPKPDELNPRFLGYFLTSPTMQAQMLAWAHAGATRKALTKGMIESFKVPKPDFPTQQRIAHILGALDDKIGLNRRMSRTLEKMAATLFKSWFIDFDPVSANAEGRDTGLPKDIADLFPDEFENSELGPIPKGWKVERLGDILELAYGKSLRSQERRPGPVAVYGSNGQIGWHDSVLVKGPGIVVGRKGNPGIVTWAPADFFPIDTTFFVVPKRSCQSLYFLFHVLRIHELQNLGADSAVPGLNRNIAYMSQQVVPPGKVLSAFDALLKPLYDRMCLCSRQNHRLAGLRDTLLPKLLTGEIPLTGTTGVAEEEPVEAAKTGEAVYTIGHSNHSIGQFTALLKKNGITAVADVRSAPFSRHNPQFNQDALARSLKKEGIAYVFLGKELGARPEESECYDNGAASFERIAARPAFAQGIERVLKGKENHRIALLCAEKEPLDCHRTILVCRHLCRQGVNIKHILADGSIEEHQNTERRLLKLMGLEPTLYESPAAASERREAAYAKRGREIAYRRGIKEREYGRPT